jgi:sulfite reductase (NADPH) hemoprotein beta-component
VKVHDIGLRMHKNAAGEIGFEVIVGGGQGRTPAIGVTIREFLPKQHLLSYLEAVLRVYNLLGRRDNLYKSRIKILVAAVGAAKFAAAVEEEWTQIKDGPLALPAAEIARIEAQFAPPSYGPADPFPQEIVAKRQAAPAFAGWMRSNVAAHRHAGHAIVTLSLKPAGGIPGDATADQMEAVADLADRYSLGEIRVSHAQNLVLPHVRRADLPALWDRLTALGLATANIGLAGDIIACPGLDYCSLATARSIPIAQQLSARFADPERQREIGELAIKISGCINACGHHHVGHIGILGVDKKGEEHYQITLGGSADESASIGDIIGPAFPAEAVVDAVATIVDIYLERRQDGERFLDAYRRLGAAPFKEKLYAAHQAR